VIFIFVPAKKWQFTLRWNSLLNEFLSLLHYFFA
jgi:hypothetical protein